MGDNACVTCGGDTQGYKCDLCGAQSSEHEEEHSCGGDHCMPKCVNCGEAEVKCACE